MFHEGIGIAVESSCHFVQSREAGRGGRGLEESFVEELGKQRRD
jgi:hypothetical protein